MGKAGAILFNYNNMDNNEYVTFLLGGRTALANIIQNVDFDTWPCELLYDDELVCMDEESNVNDPECAQLSGINLYFDGTYVRLENDMNDRGVYNYHLDFGIFVVDFYILHTGVQWVIKISLDENDNKIFFVCNDD